MMYMKSEEGSTITVSISGVLCFDDRAKFKLMISEILESGAKDVVFNLARTVAVDSAGIGLFLLAKDKLDQEGRSYRLTRVGGAVARSVQLAKVEDIFPVEFDDLRNVPDRYAEDLLRSRTDGQAS